MTRKFSELIRIDNNDPITPETHHDFLLHLQHAILLALKERERLTLMEFRQAEQMLKQKRLQHAKQKLQEAL